MWARMDDMIRVIIVRIIMILLMSKTFIKKAKVKRRAFGTKPFSSLGDSSFRFLNSASHSHYFFSILFLTITNLHLQDKHSNTIGTVREIRLGTHYTINIT